jgi:hypothetical protein
MLLRYFMRSVIAFFILLGPALAQGETSALDDSTAPLKSCEWTTMSSVMEGIQLVSWSSGSRICELATNSLGRPIPIGVFRFPLKAAGVLHIQGAGEAEDRVSAY